MASPRKSQDAFLLAHQIQKLHPDTVVVLEVEQDKVTKEPSGQNCVPMDIVYYYFEDPISAARHIYDKCVALGVHKCIITSGVRDEFKYLVFDVGALGLVNYYFFFSNDYYHDTRDYLQAFIDQAHSYKKEKNIAWKITSPRLPKNTYPENIK